jgi:predicted transcriptional regulator
LLPRSNQLTVSHAVLRLIPGRSAMEIMEVLWTEGECSVREVVGRLQRPVAYTTVMTMLDRLFKVDVLRRRMQDRAYIYSPRVTREQWREALAQEVVARLQASPEDARELMACLLKTLLAQQPQLLEEVNHKLGLPIQRFLEP